MHLKSETIFREEMMTEGLFWAVFLHAIFNICLEMGWVFVMVPFLVIGYAVLNHLFNKKEDRKNYGDLLHLEKKDRQKHQFIKG